MPVRYRHEMPFGAHLRGDGVSFRLYAPAAQRVDVVVRENATERRLRLGARGSGWFETLDARARPGSRYSFSIDGANQRVPDPASRFQPDGVHGASAVIDPAAFQWSAIWGGLPWSEHVFYELHVGTFTPEGTYAAARTKLAHIVALGATALEMMPIGDFPGERNWGYDGVLPFAPARAYGTPDELKSLIDDAHAHGLAVYLDVVYNHFGPEGNYLYSYAPTFYDTRGRTPWGAALALQPDRDPQLRAFFIENALYWMQEYRFDGLRLDAVHAIEDGAGRSFLRELASSVAERSDRPVYLVLENDRNEAMLLEAGYRAQWNDDAHHAMHVIATGERDGYYRDYSGDAIRRLGTALTTGFGYQGEFSAYRNAERGTPSRHLGLGSFVTFLQNHDQVGNRPYGDRIASLASPEALRAMVAVLLLAPSPPLLFMGEEWAADSPFLFFCDFEPELGRAVTTGRRSEFASFGGFSEPAVRRRIPDPSARATFRRSKLNWSGRSRQPHATWLAYYRTLLAIRRTELSRRIVNVSGEDASCSTVGARGLQLRYRLDDGATLVLEANLGPQSQAIPATSNGRVLFSTHDRLHAGAAAPPWSVRWSVDD